MIMVMVTVMVMLLMIMKMKRLIALDKPINLTLFRLGFFGVPVTGGGVVC